MASRSKFQNVIDSIRLTKNPHKHYTFENDLWRRKGKLVVGDNAELRQQILQHFHDSAIGGHSRYEMTYRRIKDHFYWKGMQKEVKKWVQHCHLCKKCKPLLQFPVGILQPLSIPDRPWKSISMEFIVGLPKSCFMTVIFVVIDCLTKYAHFLPLAHPFGG